MGRYNQWVEKRIENEKMLENEARDLVARLTHGTSAAFITLSGELGAGKTTFSQAIARTLGVVGVVTSPTFVLEKIYQLPETAPWKRLVHIDAYRLTGGSDLAPLAFTELLADPDNIILLEWPERVSDALPVPAVALSISINEDQSRTFTYG